MKRNLTFLLGLFLTAGLQFTAVQNLNAQAGTQGDGFIFQLDLGTEVLDIREGGDCGFGYATYGGEVTTDFCADLAWAYDITPDSICCDTITMDLTGKIAIVRRGACNFSIKVYYAQQAGAVAVLILNHYADGTHTPCTYSNMSGGTFADLVTIPSIFLGRQYGELIDAAIAAGHQPSACFALPRALDAAAPYHYSTPVTQVDTLDHIGMRFVNREPNTLYNVGITAVIDEPGGTSTTLTATIDSALTGEPVYQYFPPYLPPAVLGTFTVTYSNDFYTESRDTLRRTFVHTPYTFAADNLVIDPGGISNDASFQTANLFSQSGALCLTGDSPGSAIATHATFGLFNAATLYVPNPLGGENDINVFLYDADVDDDGTWEINNDGSGSFDDLAGGLVGFAVYAVNGTEGPDSLFSVAIDDLNNPGTFEVALKPNHPYYISLAYDGVAAGTGIMPRFCNSLDEFYLNFPTTPLYLGQMFTGGWAGAIVIQRLQLKGFDPSSSTKPVAQLDVDIELLPNPAVDVLRVNLDFGAETVKSGTVTLMDGLGKTMRLERLSNFQNGQLTFNVNDLASGTYLLSVRTPDGVAIRKVMVCH